ncbi:flagellar biosynthesis anti-sigma factor FlgM [Thermosediminibacter litoriperuensis]|uniref:Negative regulator of flagellin synthesis n=1 Tax=Thermosediminibacter litoriperuensis TaxID=291989 RepID=A0A5S5AJ45_9FIRM|nr:flagellar biosynthesis anti-sigma factor FlgM [Thermosediminibacter litoriperuensis]TYP50912.1 FlgM family anti-sigma-28 factor [Thermosediminibacter litoriperuensis]
MNINRTGLEGVIKLYETAAREIERKSEKKSDKPWADKISLSSDAVELRKALELASKTGEIWEEKVALLKERIEKGTYNIEGRLIAGKMIEDFLGGKLI